jgi:hypothetical protein
MSNADYLPRSDEKIFTWTKNLYAVAQDKYGDWQIPAPASFLKKPLAAFQKTLEAVNNPNRGRLDIAAKNAAKKELVSALRGYVRLYLRYNPALGDADRQGLGLRPLCPRKRPAIPAPSSRPVLVLSNRDIRQVKVEYRDSGSNKRGKPADARGIEIRWGLFDSPPAGAGEILSGESGTRSPHLLSFENNQRGKMVYVAARWETFTGRKGPWSEVYNTIVP